MSSSKTKVTHKQWRLYHANLVRTLTTAKRWIALGLVLIINIFAIFIIGNHSTTSTQIWNTFQIVLGVEILYISVMECILVYADDFKAKTMQSAIGRGIKRRHVILCKLVELLTVLFIDYALILLSVIIVNFIIPVQLNVNQLLDTAVTLISFYLQEVSLITVAMIPSFFLQSGGASVLIYLALHAGVLKFIVALFDDFVSFSLQSILINNLVDRFRSYLLLGTFSPLLLLGILIWIIVSYFLTTLLFARKELDF